MILTQWKQQKPPKHMHFGQKNLLKFTTHNSVGGVFISQIFGKLVKG